MTLTPEMKQVVDEQKLGFVASVCDDGTPNLSPKATMLVLDDEHIMFGDIRSPNTVRNLKQAPMVEINFVDVFSRKGFRFKGEAHYHESGSERFDELLPSFEQWGELCARFRGIVVVHVQRALPLLSPAYDSGAKEEDLRETWRQHFLGAAKA